MKRPEIKSYKHNALFRPDAEHWYYDACVGNNGGPYDERAYALGYFRASERLFNSIMEDRTSLDLLIYPLVYNSRHGMELYLKHLANRLPWLWDENSLVSPTHKLIDNWEFVKGYLKREDSFAPEATVPTIDGIVNDFIAIDPNGEAFRFPASRKGQQSLEEMSNISIVVLAEYMKTTHETFDFWCDTFNELWNGKCSADRDGM